MEPTERKGKTDVHEYKDGVKVHVDEDAQHMRVENPPTPEKFWETHFANVTPPDPSKRKRRRAKKSESAE